MKIHKKICFVTPIYLPANLYGSDFYVKTIAENLAKIGFNVTVITSNALTPRYWYDKFFGKKIKQKYEVIEGVKIVRLECNQLVFIVSYILANFLNKLLPIFFINNLKILYSGPYLVGLQDALQVENFDTVHCSPFPLYINKQVIKAVENLKKKPILIFTPFYHSQVKDYENPELKKIFQRADIIHVISNTEKNEISRRFSINAKKIIVVPLFIDTSNMHTMEHLKKDIELFKKKYRLAGKKIILFAGIKGVWKGSIDILLSINKLHKTNKEYILIAIGTNTREWNRAKTKVDKDCVLDFEYKTGKEKEIIFASCDIFCLPSKSEAFGLVYLEAWHKKKPVIAAEIPAVEEFIDKDGIFVEFGNKEKIIEAITKLATDKSVASALGRAGNKKLINTYSFSKVFPKYITMFN